MTIPETIEEAVTEAIRACGGTKKVAAMLWPAIAAQNLDAARRKLANCVNPECADKLSLGELMLVLSAARAAGCHVAMQYLSTALGYADPQPIEPEDEKAKLQREFIESTRALAKLAQRIESLDQPTRLRAAS
jgi:hypothetical protein